MTPDTRDKIANSILEAIRGGASERRVILTTAGRSVPDADALDYLQEQRRRRGRSADKPFPLGHGRSGVAAQVLQTMLRQGQVWESGSGRTATYAIPGELPSDPSPPRQHDGHVSIEALRGDMGSATITLTGPLSERYANHEDQLRMAAALLSAMVRN